MEVQCALNAPSIDLDTQSLRNISRNSPGNYIPFPTSLTFTSSVENDHITFSHPLRRSIRTSRLSIGFKTPRLGLNVSRSGTTHEFPSFGTISKPAIIVATNAITSLAAKCLPRHISEPPSKPLNAAEVVFFWPGMKRRGLKTAASEPHASVSVWIMSDGISIVASLISRYLSSSMVSSRTVRPCGR